MKIEEIKTEPRLVSIIIPNYFMGKSGKLITDMDEALWFAGHCFERIKKYTTLPYELILVDDGSVVGQELLKEWADILITNKKNLGFAKACNKGIDAARGNWICVVNNDIFVWSGWLEALIKTFEDNENCGVAMPALMKQTKDGREALRFEQIDLSKNYLAYGKGAEFGSCFLMKKELVDRVKKMNNGKFYDENFHHFFGEDRRLWRQARQLGYETYRSHKVRVFHQGNVSVSKFPGRKKYTIPNREYLRRITKLEEEGEKLSEERKKQIREQVDIDYEKGLFSE